MEEMMKDENIMKDDKEICSDKLIWSLDKT